MEAKSEHELRQARITIGDVLRRNPNGDVLLLYLHTIQQHALQALNREEERIKPKT